MNKFIASFLMTIMLALSVPLLANAQTRRCTCTTRRSSVSRNRRTSTYRNRSYQTQGYTYQKPSFYRRHRNVINTAAAAGGGALLGGLIGGNRRGIGYGALLGAGAGALYTYVLKPKKRRY